ncbi:MAG: hypothetical protein WAO02_06565 [Verrucomicrobiia bacterium]
MYQKQTRFDDTARWWFLTPDGFAKFKCNPVAQGYEILSRHPSFHLPKKTWQELGKSARGAFLFKYKRELYRMGLLEIAWLGPKAITFNCTDGVPSILAAIHCWLEAECLLKRAPKDKDRDRIRASPDCLIFSINNQGDPNMVTIDWSKLFKKCKVSDDIVAVIRTFLEHNPKYRQYRECRLAELEKRKKRRERHLAELKIRRPPRHLKKTKPDVITLACAAWDCQQAGALFQDKITRTHLEAIGRKSRKSGDSRNHLRSLRKLQMQAGFKIPRLSTRTAKQTPPTEDPINVISILYPHFHAEN